MATKYIVNMVDADTGEILERRCEDEVFDTYEEAQELADYLAGCTNQGAEILQMSDPLGYEDGEYGNPEDVEFEIEEIEE